MKKTYSLLLGLTLISSTGYAARRVSSAPLVPPPLTNLHEASFLILGDVEDHNFPEACERYLKKLEVDVDSMDVTKLSASELSLHAESIAKNSWKIRSILHSRLSEFSKECVFQVQSNFRQFRFIEDYLLELARKVEHKKPAEIEFQKQPIPMLDTKQNFYEFRTNGEAQFEPGDLLITRGVSFLSGMIARLGRRSTQFSHVVMIYKDPETQKLKTIESYVGVGVAFYDFDFALKNENARILWLRSKDRALGKRASEMMGSVVKARLDAKNPIKYDYELNFDDHTTMSCAEVSQVAFQMASDNQVKIPFYPNEISGAKSIIGRLKLVEGSTYEPGDMEIDPRFELMGEFQDLRLTRDSRQKDAIMTVMFDWMINRNYELKDNFKAKMAGGVIHKVRKTFMWPLVKKVLKLEDFSKELPANMIKAVSLINELGQVMLEELHKRDQAFEKKHGVPMGHLDFYKELEEMRATDLQLYENKKTKKQAKIHRYIRAGKNKK